MTINQGPSSGLSNLGAIFVLILLAHFESPYPKKCHYCWNDPSYPLD